jgi:RNA polymerase sigma-54 factor
MKQSLQLKLSQHLTLTPQLQQSIKLLQLSTVELSHEVERYLLENPLLERVDGDDGDDEAAPTQYSTQNNERESAPDSGGEPERDAGDNATSEQFWQTGSASQGSPDDDREELQIPAAEVSLQDHLLSQLGLMQLSDDDRKWVSLVIAHVDDDGYLSADLDELSVDAQDYSEHPLEELKIALKHVQHMEPAGVGARSLGECLEIQLRLLPVATPGIEVALEIVRRHLDLLASRDFTKLKRALRCEDAQMHAARCLITSLDPRPGRSFGSADTRYVAADVIVRRVRGKWQVSLNQEVMPRLRVNQHYAKLLQLNRSGDGRNLTGQLQEARWLVKNIQQRFDTILRVSQAIVEQQRHFFDHGEVAMRPLVLREIAEQVNLHESTVSRVTTQKYMLTPRGLFELKYFFASSLVTDEGGATSSTAIRALIRQFVLAEDNRKPLSDHRISALLAAQGIVVARRTVAKYREAMHIQTASMRRALSG